MHFLLKIAVVLCLICLGIAIALPNFIGAQDRSVYRIPPEQEAARNSYQIESFTDTTEDSIQELNTEDYASIQENPFLNATRHPLSTFGLDVDTASYSNIRRFIETQETLPPIDAVRIEEMINYFPYAYPEPSRKHPFSIRTYLTECPWNPEHQLLGIGLRSRSINQETKKPSNLVFLLDVSGSMSEPNKLPLLKRSMKLLVDHLDASDTVSIVVYAGAAGLVLPPTPGNQKEAILSAIDALSAGGSTAGAEGIMLAYQTAQQNLKKGGNNRVILATDGDFNVGVSSDAALSRLIQNRRDAGIFLTVLGFGTDNYKDNKLEILADQGNGNYAYIDNLMEARKVLVQEMGATLHTVAKDVKFQVEFNPLKVATYRLIGYENRLMAAEDFNNDKKDAGDLGAGASVTAMYEIVPTANTQRKRAGQPPLKYQSSQPSQRAQNSSEILTLQLRYKHPDKDQSQRIQQSLNDQPTNWAQLPEDFRFAVGVASFGMLLRQSEHLNHWGYDETLQILRANQGEDVGHYRSALISLVHKAKRLSAKE